ncbi:MAG: VOC family protein, partial [Nannocystaceae bacterium]
ELGSFSVSLAVKDLATSRAFYEHLGFEQIGGNPEQNWLILRNGTTVIGLFQGMFESNILTFNPGWSTGETNPTEFTDVRQLASKLHEAGIKTQGNLEESPKGPGHFTITDPDGNTILVDQHV